MPRSPSLPTSQKATGGVRRPAPAAAAPKTPAAPLAVAGKVLLEVPLDAVTPSPDNPRDGLGDLVELQRSIRERGILEPLVVGAEVDGKYPLVFGHRRLAAARLANRKTVPVIVRDDLDPRGVAIDRLVENLQRVDLAPIEEARGYAQLKDRHKMTQKAIAEAVGRNQGHVSKRLALLELPDAIARRVGAGIPVDVALEVAKLPGEVQVDLVERTNAGDDKAFRPDRFEADMREAAALAGAREQQRDAIGKARRAKVTLLNVDGDVVGAEPRTNQEDGPAPLAWLHQVDPKAHAKLPCHAAFIRPVDQLRWHGEALVPVCTDPASHKGKAAPAPRRSKEDRAADEARENVGVLRDARRAFIGQLVDGRTPKGAAEHLVAQLLAGGIGDEPPAFEEALRLVGPGQPTGETMAGVLAGSHDGRLRAALAAQLLADDATLHWALARGAGAGVDGHPVMPGPLEVRVMQAHLAFLVAGGYQLHPLERAVVDEPAPTWRECIEGSGYLELAAADRYGGLADHGASARAWSEEKVLREAVADATVRGVPDGTWLEPGRKTAGGRCTECGAVATALAAGRLGKHKAGGGTVPKGGAACSGVAMTIHEVREQRAAKAAADAGLEACPTCEGLGRVGPAGTELCPDCAGRGLVSPAKLETVAAAG